MRSGRTLAVLLAIASAAAGCGGDDGDPSAVTATSTTSLADEVDTSVAPSTDADADADGTGSEEPDDGPAEGRWPTPLAELDPNEPAAWTVEVLQRFPHDPAAFTQGLEQLDDGTLLESTGLRGESTIRRVDPMSGSVLDSAPLDDAEFGEGATVSDGTIIQLTWQAEVARRWDVATLDPLPSWEYTGEGWGLCRFDDRFAMSNGSSSLTFRDLDDFSVLEQVTVTFGGEEVVRLNELECVDGHVVANIWITSTIVVIRPDGRIVATIDAQPLVDEVGDEPDVLNGIAVRDDETLWLTGKLWPTLFAVRVVPVA